MKLRRDLEIAQKSTWYLAHRLRKALDSRNPLLIGSRDIRGGDPVDMVGVLTDSLVGKRSRYRPLAA